ncbi:MAG: Disulfide bond formation protein C, partial [Chlamydiae bacterium]|nr:Disulfide bond formation protein C [Chlamydiota bacterium]
MKKFALFIPWLLVCIGTVGSLFFSEMSHKEPCTLCWYQRVILFPLAIILGIAAFRNAYRIILYVLPLALIGFALSLYHVIMIEFFAQTSTCPACTLKAVSDDPITFPFLSLIAFTILNILLIWIYVKHKR